MIRANYLCVLILQKGKDWHHLLKLSVPPCDYSIGEYSSSIIQKEGKGVKAFDVNTRSTYAMRSCVLGIIALEIFCGLMNLPPPITKKNYQKVSKKLRETTRDVAERSMLPAICKVKEKEGTDMGASVEGTWQRGVFSSLKKMDKNVLNDGKSYEPGGF